MACNRQEEIYFSIRYQATSGGTILGETEQIVREGENGTEVIAVADEGYIFLRWSDGKTEHARQEESVQANSSFTAEFIKRKYALHYQAEQGGHIEGAVDQLVEFGENGEAVTAVAEMGYRFVQWSDGIQSATRREERVSLNLSVVAQFENEIQHEVSYLATTGGSIFGESYQIVPEGSNTTWVAAIPDEGYRFVRWSDEVASPTRMDENVKASFTVIAIFERIVLEVEFDTEGDGYIEGASHQSVLYGENIQSVTAVPNLGWQFSRWSDGITSPTRADENVQKDIHVTAIFTQLTYTVTYLCEGSLGRIEGTLRQTVKGGEDAKPVMAVPDEQYAFVRWSDNLETAERQDKNILSDLIITAYFGIEINYTVESDKGGKLYGALDQRLLEGETGERVIAVPDAGYVFTGWSDLSLSCEHETGFVERNWEYVAYFEPTQKEFKYDYGKLFRSPMSSTVKVERDKLAKTKFIVPEMNNYTFLGWYTSETYTTKVADETGRLLLGYYTFCLEEQTLFARWEKEGEEEKAPVYKVLLTMTDEIHALLYSQKMEKDVEIDYKMTGMERRIFALVPLRVSDYLNEWFEGKVIFEVDTYFTTDPIGTVSDRAGKDLIGGGYSFGVLYYSLWPDNILEIGGLLGKYHSILNTFGFNDYESIIGSTSVAGDAAEKFGSISIENCLDFYIMTHKPLQSLHRTILQSQSEGTWFFIETYLHEFTHTAEAHYRGIFPYHEAVFRMNDGIFMEATRLYLLNRYIVDGKRVGIPEEFWQHKIDVDVNYVPAPINGRTVGIVRIVGQEMGDDDYVTTTVPYGADLLVEAVAKEGYRFVRWSDGVTTAVRHDRNIISYVNVKAIFEKLIE